MKVDKGGMYKVIFKKKWRSYRTGEIYTMLKSEIQYVVACGASITIVEYP